MASLKSNIVWIDEHLCWKVISQTIRLFWLEDTKENSLLLNFRHILILSKETRELASTSHKFWVICVRSSKEGKIVRRPTTRRWYTEQRQSFFKQRYFSFDFTTVVLCKFSKVRTSLRKKIVIKNLSEFNLFIMSPLKMIHVL